MRVGVTAGVLVVVVMATIAAARAPIAWLDVPASVRVLLEARGLSPEGFGTFVERVRATTARRVREGQLDHVIFYALQSTRFTTLPPIEPALSAKALADSLDPDTRTRFRADPLAVPLSNIPRPVERRLAALIAAFDKLDTAGADTRNVNKRETGKHAKDSADDARLRLFGQVVNSAFGSRDERRAGLLQAYLRAMRFLYEKEFETQATRQQVENLYQTRGLSTDTAVEAGYLVHLGLETMHALDAGYRVRRVLIVGPGLDLAPRTGLLESAPPQSYQPWAVIDSLVSLGLSRLDDLEVTAADINPLVIDHVNAASHAPPALVLLSGLADDDRTALTDEYRRYFAKLGGAIGHVAAAAPRVEATLAKHLKKTVQVEAAAANTLRAEPLDLVTERLPAAQARFDLVIITNVLPYLDDRELILALANVSAMLAPGGVLLHNEPRPIVGDITTRVGLPFIHARTAIIAKVAGASAPLSDSVFLHRRSHDTGAFLHRPSR
jgi:hypothetical protein